MDTNIPKYTGNVDLEHLTSSRRFNLSDSAFGHEQELFENKWTFRYEVRQLRNPPRAIENVVISPNEEYGAYVQVRNVVYGGEARE